MKVLYNLDGSRTWVAIENMTQEQKRTYDGQVNRPSQAQEERQASSKLTRLMMMSPAHYRRHLQRIKRVK